MIPGALQTGNPPGVVAVPINHVECGNQLQDSNSRDDEEEEVKKKLFSMSQGSVFKVFMFSSFQSCQVFKVAKFSKFSGSQRLSFRHFFLDGPLVIKTKFVQNVNSMSERQNGMPHNKRHTDRNKQRLFCLVVKTKVVQNVNRMSDRQKDRPTDRRTDIQKGRYIWVEIFLDSIFWL